ncbi:hypothetical protein WJX72_000910 [[Myrmecia] bisecta]|uniref:Uncharacterized protein n=1 Tax=[Myrmecia] bisecta TaxID=41462 RepID=A0AAW1QNT8_9CHLO
MPGRSGQSAPPQIPMPDDAFMRFSGKISGIVDDLADVMAMLTEMVPQHAPGQRWDGSVAEEHTAAPLSDVHTSPSRRPDKPASPSPGFGSKRRSGELSLSLSGGGPFRAFQPVQQHAQHVLQAPRPQQQGQRGGYQAQQAQQPPISPASTSRPPAMPRQTSYEAMALLPKKRRLVKNDQGSEGSDSHHSL